MKERLGGTGPGSPHAPLRVSDAVTYRLSRRPSGTAPTRPLPFLPFSPGAAFTKWTVMLTRAQVTLPAAHSPAMPPLLPNAAQSPTPADLPASPPPPPSLHAPALLLSLVPPAITTPSSHLQTSCSCSRPVLQVSACLSPLPPPSPHPGSGSPVLGALRPSTAPGAGSKSPPPRWGHHFAKHAPVQP